jgi:hypothetical protein
LRQGKITRINMGPMKHTGTAGYLDAKTTLPDGTQYVDFTVRMVTELIDVAQARWHTVLEQQAAAAGERLATTESAATPDARIDDGPTPAPLGEGADATAAQAAERQPTPL